jgi:hypothetical protein
MGSFVEIFNAARAYPKLYAPYHYYFSFYGCPEEWLKSINKIPEKVVNLFVIYPLKPYTH